jgi:hypothetical protein
MRPRDSTIPINKKVIDLGVHSNFMRQLEREVMDLQKLLKSQPSLKKKLEQKLNVISQTAYAGGIVSFLLTQQQYVSTLLQPNNQVIPQDLVDFIIQSITIIVVIGIGAAAICLMLASLWKMINGKKSDEWIQNVIKGFSGMLAAPLIVALIVMMFVLLFSHFPLFSPVLKGIDVFFHTQASTH